MFRQVFVARLWKPRGRHEKLFVTYNGRGILIEVSHDIPEGEYPTVYIPRAEFRRLVREFHLDSKRIKLTEEEIKERRRESQRAYRKRLKERKQQMRDPSQRPRRLNNDDIEEVRRLSSLGYKNVEIANMKGVSDSLISKIKNYKRYADRVAA
jgi:hypothetical protein